jgi:hypothetical protein
MQAPLYNLEFKAGCRNFSLPSCFFGYAKRGILRVGNKVCQQFLVAKANLRQLVYVFAVQKIYPIPACPHCKIIYLFLSVQTELFCALNHGCMPQ